jgi:hypothetical protein
MRTDIAESLALAGIDDMTRDTLRQTWPMIREAVPAALRAALAPAAGRAAMPGQPTDEQIDAACQAQARHWEALFSARFDDAYARSLREVAAAHASVGLDPRWLVASYLPTLTELHSLVLAAHGNSMMTWSARSRLERAIRAVDQAVVFDLQLRVAAYAEQIAAMADEKMLRVARQLQQPAPSLMGALLLQYPPGRRATADLFATLPRALHDSAPDEPAAPGACPIAFAGFATVAAMAQAVSA